MSDYLPNRQTIRLPGFDYSQGGYYFVTICAHERQNLFGNIIVGARHASPDSIKNNPPYSINKNAHMQLNKYGEIVQSVWNLLPKHYLVKLDEFQIMPNHIHFILILLNNNLIKNKEAGEACLAPTKKHTLGTVIGSFKSESTKQIRKLLKNPKKQIFQRNYFERIIRSEREYKQIIYYIQNNPQNWDKDKNNPVVFTKILSTPASPKQ